MSSALGGEQLAELTGEALLRDFGAATQIAETIGTLESWTVTGSHQAELVELAQTDLVVVDQVIARIGLTNLLSSREEQGVVKDLLEESRTLDLARFIGSKAAVTAEYRGPIRTFVVANQASVLYRGNPYLESGFYRKKKTANITSFNPAEGVIRIGENRHGKLSRVAFGIGGGFLEVHPFDPQTGEQVVDIEIINTK